MLMGGGWSPSYLINDEFTIEDAAPIASPRTCEPGPGTLTVIDTTDKASITGGKLVFSGKADWGDPKLHGSSQTVSVGLAVFFRIFSDVSAANYIAGGWTSTTTGVVQARIVYKPQFSGLYPYAASADTNLYESGYPINAQHSIALVHRGTGGMFFLGKPYGGAWTLIFVDNTNVSTYVYPALTIDNYVSGSVSADDFRVVALHDPWNSENGIATAIVANSGANGTSTMNADGFVEATWQATTGAVFDLMFRRTDDNNTWIARCDQAASKIYLYEKQSGTETERGATGGVAQTFTNGTNYRVWAKCYGNIINVGVNKVQKINYGSATFNATATGVKNSLAVTNLISWPRLITGAALDILEKAYP